MSDYRATWEELEARRLAAHLERTAARVLLLRDRYETAMGMVSGEITPEPRHPDEYVRRTEGAGRAPTNVPALDLVLEVEAFVSDWLPLLRGTVRAGSWRPAGDTRAERTGAGLTWINRRLPTIWDEDPGVGADLSDSVWSLDRNAASVLGERARAFPLSEPCGTCGVPALWASPERMQVKCGNPDCGAGWAVSAPVPVGLG